MKQNNIEAIFKINSQNNRDYLKATLLYFYQKIEISKLREMLEFGKHLYHEHGNQGNMEGYLENIHHKPIFN